MLANIYYGENHDRKFAALALVDGHRPGQGQFGKIGVIVADLTLGELDDHLLLLQVDVEDGTQVAVKHFSLLIVHLLNHLIPHTQDTSTSGQFRLAWPT